MKINGWTLKFHPVFSEQYKKLIDDVEKLKTKDPEKYGSSPVAKLLANIQKLIYEVIPNNPASDEFQQGNTLGKTRRHWFRAKFNRRFRLFFRFRTTEKIIIYCWVNDENTLRQSGAKTDPYQVFTKMLNKGNPPDSWEELLKHSTDINDKTTSKDSIEICSEEI